MSASPEPLERLGRPGAGSDGVDRKLLAGLLLDIARNMKPDLAFGDGDARPSDLRLEQLRSLLLGREIQLLSRLSGVMEDPEQLAAAVGRVLPGAFAQASADARLGQVLAPVVERAARVRSAAIRERW